MARDGLCDLQVKVGKDVKADLERVAVIQREVAVGQRCGSTPIGYSKDAGEVRGIAQSEGIELFEQPCDDRTGMPMPPSPVSTVPLMLDSPSAPSPTSTMRLTSKGSATASSSSSGSAALPPEGSPASSQWA
jgi:hypothetical protein